MRDHTELPDNLTFEDFDRYANREPDFEGNWIYKVDNTQLRHADRLLERRNRPGGMYIKTQKDINAAQHV